MRIVRWAAICVAVVVATAAQAEASVLSLDYSTSSIGGGQYQYDFELTLTNQDGTFTAGQNFNWIIFGDAPFPGPSPLSGFLPTAETFPNPDVLFRDSNGGHNGPTWIDLSRNVGWVPIGVGDSVTWSGTASINITTGLLFSNLVGSGTHADFQLANFVPTAAPPTAPEPASAILLSMGGGLMYVGRKLRRRQATKAVA